MYQTDTCVPGPKNAAEALKWTKEAMAAGHYILDAHFLKRCQERRYSLHDAKRIVATSTTCVPYADFEPLAGGTCWRVTGEDCDGEAASIGIEAYRDHLGRWIILITIMSE